MPDNQPALLDTITLHNTLEQMQNLKSGSISDKKFIEIIKKLTEDQFNQINREFYLQNKTSISQFIIDIIKDQATEDLCLAVLAPKYYIWSKSIHISFLDLLNNSDLLITAILSLDIIDLFKVKQQYKLQFKTDLVEDFNSFIQGHSFWQQLLRQWITRDTPGVVSSRFSVEKDAKALDLATKGSGTDIEIYVNIFTTSTTTEFKDIILNYENLVGVTFKKSLEDEFLTDSLDYYAAMLVTERLRSPEALTEFIFSYCFTEKNGDKPMLNFLISMFKDKVDLSKIKGAQSKIKQQINPIQAGNYQNAVLSFFGFK
ncbi:Annexin 11 [Spironucleus salmonicida]|uniref:Annexin 11 n=1 Tax=Spironucleus salmonicida TaxID=348837 RepID=V6LSL8_9EUKA|nr:Annexin 11 [Spironucleus salmonicida]|eukprot:EST47233.1 Annexin 11 [Spironucleus salmonicida]